MEGRRYKPDPLASTIRYSLLLKYNAQSVLCEIPHKESSNYVRQLSQGIGRVCRIICEKIKNKGLMLQKWQSATLSLAVARQEILKFIDILKQIAGKIHS